MSQLLEDRISSLEDTLIEVGDRVNRIEQKAVRLRRWRRRQTKRWTKVIEQALLLGLGLLAAVMTLGLNALLKTWGQDFGDTVENLVNLLTAGSLIYALAKPQKIRESLGRLG